MSSIDDARKFWLEHEVCGLDFDMSANYEAQSITYTCKMCGTARTIEYDGDVPDLSVAQTFTEHSLQVLDVLNIADEAEQQKRLDELKAQEERLFNEFRQRYGGDPQKH